MNDVLLDVINEETLCELDNNVRMVPLTLDIMLKSVLERNDYVCKRFLISILDLGISPDECNIKHYNKELPLDNYKEYKKIVDFNIVINDNIYINMEMNRTSFENVKRRNFLYHNKKTSTILKRGMKINTLDKYKVIQLNLNYYDKSINIGEDIIVPYSIKTNSIYLEENKIYIRYLDYYKKLYYNEDIEKTESDYWLALLTAENFTELNNILSKILDVNNRENLVKDVLKLSMDEFILDRDERIALDKIVEMDTKKNARREGLEEGIEQKSREMIKAMLENNASYEFISKVSGKIINEIKEIEKTIK